MIISFADLYLNLYYHDNGDVCNDRTNRDHVPMETTWRSAKQELPVTVFKDLLTDSLISDVFYLYTNCVHTYQPFQVVYCYARCVLLTKSVNRSSPQSASLLFSMLFIRIFNPVFFVCFLLQLYILTLYMLHDNIANFCTLLMF